jgi:integrase
VGRPVEALTTWLESEAITLGPVFRHIDRWENVSDRAMSAAGINHMIKRRLALAGYDEADYSAHGLRAGYLTQAAKDGVGLPEAMRQSQHRSVQQASSYYNDAEAELSRAARLME